MKVEVEDLSSVKKILHIEVPEERVTSEIDNAYKTLKKTAKIKGFRPGKAPRSILENLYKKNVHADVSGKLLQESFPEALKETKLNIVGQPVIDPPELDAKGPYKYDITVEVRPEIGDVDFKGLKLKKTLYKVSETEIDMQLERLQKSQVQYNPIEEKRTLQENDFAVIDYELFKDGKPLAESQKVEDYSLKIGDGLISKEFDEQLIGTNPGENREIKIRFPEDHANKQIAGQEITFQVSLNEIRKEVLPEINDVFAKKGGDFENLDDLKTNISDSLKKGYENRVENELNGQVLEELLKRSDFEVPDALVDAEIESMIANMERSYAYQNISLEDLGLSREALAEQYRKPAEKQAKRYILLNTIIEQENLSLTDEEMEKGYKDISEQLNQPVEEIKTLYKQNKDRIDFLKYSMLEKRAFNLIIDHGEIEEVEPEIKSEPENPTED